MTHRSDAETTDPTPPRDDNPQDLPAFTGDATLCVKCGKLGATTSYRAAGEHGARDRHTYGPSPKGERLERACWRCDYTWDEALATDFEAPDGEPLPHQLPLRKDDPRTLSHLGADQAEKIRYHARELAAIPDITSTSSGREILHDLSVTLAALIDPVSALVEDHLDDGPDDVEYAQGARDTLEALLGAAAGIGYIAENY